ncbi:hypothetical protein EDC96DRAFT_516976 [Choanephora cucurbitarum]|nr:hypothetical protein EDC96DRAFT_516976 [Choanephora cucurbitarum]
MEYAYDFLPHQLSTGSSFTANIQAPILPVYVDSVLNHNSAAYYDNYTYQPKQNTLEQNMMSHLLQQPSYVYPVYNPYDYQPVKAEGEPVYYSIPVVDSLEENGLSQEPLMLDQTSNQRRHSLSSSMSSPSSCFSTLSSFTNPIEEKSTQRKSASLFRCTYEGCEKTFTRTYNLKSHLRTHTDQKPFVCCKCPKAFARQHDRNRHEKLHTGNKPYFCEHCNKSFARQDALNRHLKKDKRSISRRQNECLPLSPPCVSSKIRKTQLAMLKKKKSNYAH